MDFRMGKIHKMYGKGFTEIREPEKIWEFIEGKETPKFPTLRQNRGVP